MKSRKPEGMSEDQFSFELESLYKEIEHPEKLDLPQGSSEPDLGPYYELFKVPPDVAHDELKLAYERLAQAWKPEKFAEHPEWQEKAEEKLNMINKAYETILSARIRAIKAFRKRKKPIELTEIEKDAETEEDIENDYEDESTPARFGFKKAALLAGIPVFLLFCYFIIAPLFERFPEKIALKDNAPQGINKPISQAAPIIPAPAPRAPSEPVKQNIEPTKPDETVSRVEQVKPVQKPAVKPESKIGELKPVVKPVQAAAQKKEPVSKTPVKEPVKTAPAVKIPFSIQVGAVKDRSKAEDYLGKIKKDGLKASLLQTTLPGGEKGFRILVGKFQSREEALDYMNKNSIKDKYPGSFIQNVSP